jgi:hypothetical protein
VYKGNHDDEVQQLLEQFLSIMINYEVCDSHSIAVANKKLAQFHFDRMIKLPLGDARKKQQTIALSYCDESSRISIKIHGLVLDGLNPAHIVEHFDLYNAINEGRMGPSAR